MAYQQGHHQTNAIERSRSFENSPSEQFDHNMPFTHYALVYLDEQGRPRSMSSASIQRRISTVLTSELHENFLTAVREGSGFRDTVACTSPGQVKRRRKNTSDCVTNNCPIDVFDAPISHSDDSSPCGYKTMSLRIGQTKEICEYYESTLKHFQQLNCRMVAKAFIKFIEPRKQVRHPYNGGKPPPGSPPGSTGDPEKTKPKWWPPGVMHKEPDHLRKEDRIELLLHIICKLKDRGVTAEKLEEVACETKRSLKQPSHLEIILEILRVRKVQERYEEGLVDGSELVEVVDRAPSPKGDDIEGATNSEQPATSPASINTTAVHAHSTHSTSSNFTPLILESEQGRPYYATPTQSNQLFWQSVQSTPVTAETTSTHNFPSSNYQLPKHFPFWTANQGWDGMPIHYDVRSIPSSTDNTFSNVDYSTPPSSQPLSQPSIYHGTSTEVSAPLHAMHFHVQSPGDAVNLS